MILTRVPTFLGFAGADDIGVQAGAAEGVQGLFALDFEKPFRFGSNEEGEWLLEFVDDPVIKGIVLLPEVLRRSGGGE